MLGLTELGFSKNVIFETIVSTYDLEGEPNAAPMGVTMENSQCLRIRPFISTATYKNLKAKKCAVVNLTTDPELFYVTAFKEVAPNGKLPKALFSRAKSVDAPKLIMTDASVEVSVSGIDCSESDRAALSCDVKLVKAAKMMPKAYCRASFATIEAIVHATRVKVFLERREEQEQVFRFLERIRICHEVVSHVAPDSRYAQIMSDLTQRIKAWRKKSESLR